MTAKTETRDIALLGLLGAAVCCGLPVVLAAAGGVTLVGVGLGSWLLVAAGLVACVAGTVLWRRRLRAGCEHDADTS